MPESHGRGQFDIIRHDDSDTQSPYWQAAESCHKKLGSFLWVTASDILPSCQHRSHR